jgi:hypothetical protein
MIYIHIHTRTQDWERFPEPITLQDLVSHTYKYTYTYIHTHIHTRTQDWEHFPEPITLQNLVSWSNADAVKTPDLLTR